MVLIGDLAVQKRLRWTCRRLDLPLVAFAESWLLLNWLYRVQRELSVEVETWQIVEPFFIQIFETFLAHSVIHFLLRYLEESRLWPFPEKISQFLKYDPHVALFDHFSEISVIDKSSHVEFLVVVNIEVDLAESRKTKQVIEWSLLLVKH